MHDLPPNVSPMRYIHHAKERYLTDPQSAVAIAGDTIEHHALLQGREGPTAADYIAVHNDFMASADYMDALREQSLPKGLSPKERTKASADLIDSMSIEDFDIHLERCSKILEYVPYLNVAADQIAQDTLVEDQHNASPEDYGPLVRHIYENNDPGDQATMLFDLGRVILAGKLGSTLNLLAVPVLNKIDFDGNYSNKLREEVASIRGRTFHPLPEMLTLLRRDGELRYVAKEKRQFTLRLIDAYQQWVTSCSIVNTTTLLDSIKPKQEPVPTSQSPEEIAGWTTEQQTLTDSYQQLAAPYRPPNRTLEKKGLRPFITAILKDIRDPHRPLEAQQPEESAFAKRITGTLVTLEQHGKRPAATIAAEFEHLVPAEQATRTRLVQLQQQLQASGNTQLDMPASLGDDLAWIAANWAHIAPTVRKGWPSQDASVIKNIEQSLAHYKIARALLEQDPRNRLYAAAKHLGKAALTPEVRPTASRTVYRISREAAAESLSSVQDLTKNISLSNRAALILELSATPDAELYFADKATSNRDRYFIIRTQDSNGQGWFIFETLDSERATYLLPAKLLHENHGTPLENIEDELSAVLEYNKADVQLMGELADFNPQLVHQTDWTAQSHIQRIHARMQQFKQS